MMSSYSFVEGDTVRVCVSVMCGRLLRNETVILSTMNNTARGHCMKLLHAMNEYLLYFLNTAGINFIPSNQMSITLLRNSSEFYCVMIMTVFDDQTNMDKQFQIMMQPSTSTQSDSPIYMPNITSITITNRTSTIKI